MTRATRDLSLDLLKGLGCVLMVLAHETIKVGIYRYRDFIFLGGFAPVPFYAVAGVTASFQAQKYLPRSVILNYLFLFLLGFALNGFNSPDFLRPPVIHFDIIQIIAFGSLTVYLLAFYVRPPAWVYLLMGVASFLVKLGLNILMPAKDYPLLAGWVLVYPGTFPVFPWLSLFFLGVFAYRLRVLSNLGWLVVSILFFFVLSFLGLPLEYRSKYDMSVGYFLLCCVLLFGLFFLFKHLRFLSLESTYNPLLFFGQNSLLFLFVHFAAIGVCSSRLQLDENVRLFRLYPFLFWFLILFVSWGVMAALGLVARIHQLEVMFDRIWIWIVLTILVLAVPAFVPHNGLVRWTEALLGIIFGLYYHRLGHVLKERQVLLTTS